MYEVIDVAVVKPHSIVQYKNQHSQRNTMKNLYPISSKTIKVNLSTDYAVLKKSPISKLMRKCLKIRTKLRRKKNIPVLSRVQWRKSFLKSHPYLHAQYFRGIAISTLCVIGQLHSVRLLLRERKTH